ncbi:MAG: RNase P subunit p30 family protein [Acidilobaceae archaeon]
MDSAIEILRLAKRLSYKTLGLEVNEKLDLEELSSKARELNIDIVFRVIVKGETRLELRRALDSIEYKRRNLLVIASPETLDALRYSSTNKRVHIVRVKPSLEKYIDKSQVRLFRERGWGAIEISIGEVIRSTNISYLYEITRRAHILDVNTVIVSDASTLEELWSPHSIIGLLVSLGIPYWRAKSWLSSVPAYIIDYINRLRNA